MGLVELYLLEASSSLIFKCHELVIGVLASSLFAAMQVLEEDCKLKLACDKVEVDRQTDRLTVGDKKKQVLIACKETVFLLDIPGAEKAAGTIWQLADESERRQLADESERRQLGPRDEDRTSPAGCGGGDGW